MKISETGLALIREFEGCKLTAYPDPGTGGDPWTIGFGSTGPEIKRGLVITQDEADEYLRLDIERFEECVNNKVDADLTQNQFDALISLVFNIGCGAFSGSTLLRLINDGNPAAAQQFPRWSKAGGREMAGLVRRRKAEQKLFLA